MAQLADIKKEIDTLSIEIENAKVEEKVLSGRQLEIMRTLEKNHNIKSIEELEKKLTKVTVLMAKIESEINEKYNKLRTEFKW